MSKYFIFLFLFISTISRADSLLQVSADRASYDVGERALFRLKLKARPVDDELEFYVHLEDSLTHGSVALGLEVTTGDLVGLGPVFEEPGTATFVARAFQQNREVANALSQVIALSEARIAAIDQELAQSPADPEKLLAEKGELIARIQAARDALTRHRRLIGQPVSISVLVQ